jgi:Lipocalin-like domain
MKRIILAAIAGILAMPANALDGTPSPNAPTILQAIKALPDLQLCGYASCLPQDPNVERAAKELLERAQQLRRDAAQLLAQGNPGGASLRDQLVGAWELVSCEGRNDSNPVTCANVRGILVFDASGRYSWVSIPKGRPKFTNPEQPRRAIPAEEYKAVAMDMVANFGTWSVNEADKTITIHFDGALFPNVEGEDVKFPFSLSGDELKTTSLINHDVWRRIKK